MRGTFAAVNDCLSQELLQPEAETSSFSLYVHIPFCAHKCPYCDFNTYAVGGQLPEKDYIGAVCAELDFRAIQPQWTNRSVKTIFFGGGSPSLLSTPSIDRILRTVRNLFAVDPTAEISIEVNPNDSSPNWLEALHQTGINRISFGAQSFNDDILKRLGRTHSGDQIEKAVNDARAVGFSNVSIDLMFGTPAQTPEIFKSDLYRALELGTNHLSLYGLTVEAGTPFFQAAKRGVLSLPTEDASIAMMDIAETLLPQSELIRYEISNYSKPGYEAKHNIAYWTRADYLGIGAGAHSFCGTIPDIQHRRQGHRWSNIAHFGKYMEHAAAFGRAVSWEEHLSGSSLLFEQLFLGLRMVQGIDASDWKGRFGVSLAEHYGVQLAVLHEEGFLEWDRTRDHVAMTPRGFRLFDSILEQFVPEEN